MVLAFAGDSTITNDLRFGLLVAVSAAVFLAAVFLTAGFLAAGFVAGTVFFVVGFAIFDDTII